MGNRVARKTGGVVDIQLVHQMLAVLLHRLDADAQIDGDLLVGRTFRRTGRGVRAAGSKDAAVVITLQPGLYTVHVTGVGNTTGVALVEVYEIQ